MLVSVDRGETRVAILECKKAAGRGGQQGAPKKGAPKVDDDWRVGELYIERRGRRSIVGNVYKGRVDNVLGGMEAAFVDIGLEKNGFLHVDEIVTPDGQTHRRGRGRGGGPRISDLLKAGQEIVVQVTKDPIGTKGARLSMEVSIPGRYLVYVPDGDGVGVSRRLPDKERERLRKLASGLKLKDAGLIIRTAAVGARKSDMERELQYLFRLHEVLQSRVDESRGPTMVFQEADLPIRVVRDVYSREFERAVIDDEKQHHRMTSFFTRTAPELVDRVELYEGDDLFESSGVNDVFNQTLSRRVDLPHGGYLMIDHAEALTVIDVNTGSYTGRGKGSLEDTIVKTNLQAAEEVVRQLRLRDIGGIIVIDFIDMAYTRNRDKVLGVLKSALEGDRTRTHVVEISPLGLVEMTRQNVSEGVREIMNKTCPTCDGEGVVRSEETIAIDVERGLRKMAKETKAEAFLVQVHPRVAAILIGGGGKPLRELEQETGKVFHFQGSEGIPLDTFRITAEGTRDEIEERALPFKQGEEVLIRIEEPHMYNIDDAIAKIDGYVISVAGGGPFVGESKLIKIDEVKRTAAYASIVTGNGVPETPAREQRRPAARKAAVAAPVEAPDGGSGETPEEDGGKLQSNGSPSKRRRGRRGGRRRSGARGGTGNSGSE
ncbi:MAG TPA: Rne/Rng family ribonuclease [Solirubrobacterales bacterium]|nr:Rne/Rng family ribonuclease [Solirubrobacterales bacterium]